MKGLGPIRAAMRQREGELREIPLERMRHAMRRAAARLERDKREALQWVA
ncbi:hypothetical protein [Sphingomonas phage Carli]|nr:hypothetical protein [Sphingomonas phage Carli]